MDLFNNNNNTNMYATTVEIEKEVNEVVQEIRLESLATTGTGETVVTGTGTEIVNVTVIAAIVVTGTALTASAVITANDRDEAAAITNITTLRRRGLITVIGRETSRVEEEEA